MGGEFLKGGEAMGGGGEGVCRGWIKEIFDVKIMNFKTVYKPKGEGGLDRVDTFLVWNLGIFYDIFLSAYFVVISLYLAITKQKIPLYKPCEQWQQVQTHVNNTWQGKTKLE